jgi:hypothetical protein
MVRIGFSSVTNQLSMWSSSTPWLFSGNATTSGLPAMSRVRSWSAYR